MADGRPDPDVLDFLLSYCESSPLEQADASKNIDSKAVQVFAGGTIAVGLAAAGRLHGSSLWLVVAAVASYVVVAAITALILRPQWFRMARPVDQLWNEHWDRDVDGIKHSLLTPLSEDYPKNEKILRAKNRLLRLALLTATTEAALIGAALIVSLV